MREPPRSPPGLRRLNAAKLRLGDVILTSDLGVVSRVIRVATRSDISHAMIYVEDHSIVDADREGVHARNTERMLFAADCAVHVLRLRGPADAERCRAICAFARAMVGTRYATLEAMQAVSPIRASAGRGQFCSRLVAQAHAAAGVALARDPDFASPADLLRSPLFERVADAMVAVPAGEARSGGRDLTKLMREATNRALDGVRAIDRGVQNFEDVNALLLAHPHHDDAVLAAFETSGYLDVWKVHAEEMPWHFDLGLLQELGQVMPTEVETYCAHALRNAETGSARYWQNLQAYEALHHASGLRTFARMRALYEDLSRVDEARRDVVRGWFELHDPDRLNPGPIHGEAWFQVTALANPRQASLTRRVVERAGRLDVCSICGDDPAVALTLRGEGAEAQALPIMLCDECRAIREHAGERFRPAQHRDGSTR